MNISIFQLINFTIILIVLAILIRYVWSIVFDKNYQPVEWARKVKAGEVPAGLSSLEKKYADKVRLFSWWFQAERIRKVNVPGAIAELGVYKGESARILQMLLADRKLYLFDTFNGFPANDLEFETGKAAKYNTGNFADTSIEQVKKNIHFSENVIFCKGYFPETTKGLEDETFALVNMDADLYNPTRAGLEYFYPRLSPGGAIFIHDYNYKWPGIIKAVDDFVRTIPESLILIPDMEGSVLIVKNEIL